MHTCGNIQARPTPLLFEPYGPRQLGALAFWYDLGDAASLQIDSALRVSLISDKSGNSARLGFVSSGAASNTATVPTKSVTGSQVFIADLTGVDWTPGSNMTLCSKLSGNNAYELLLLTTGVIRLRIGDGASVTNVDSTASIAVTDLLPGLLQVTWTDGVGAAYSVNGVALGSSVAAVKTLTNAAVSMTIGTSFAGVMYRLQVGSAYDFNPSTASRLATSVVSGGDTYTINSTGDTGARICGERDLYQGTLTKQSVYLAWSGTNYGYSPGAAGDTYTSPNVSVTGSQTFSLDLQLLDYTPAADRVILNKLSGNDGFQVTLLTTGVVRLRIGDGASVTNVDSTAANTIVDGVRGTIGIAWTDGVGASFTQNGAALGTAVAAVKTLTNAAVAITIGATNPGKIYSAVVGSVYSFAPSSYVSGSTFVGPLGNTWAINGGATIVTRTCLYGDGVNDYMKAAAFSLSQPETVYFVGQQVSWTINEAIYDGFSTGQRMNLYQSTTTPGLNLNGGTAGNTQNANLPVATNGVVCAVFNSSSSLLRINRGAAATGDAGTNNAGGFTLFAQAALATCANATVSEIAGYAAAHDTPTQDRFALYAGRKWRISL